MLVNSINLLLWFVRVARVWPEVCLMTVYLGGLAMSAIYLIASLALISIDAPTVAEIDDIFALLDTTAISDACAEYNAIEDIQFEALGELSTLRAEAEATIREHLQLGGLLTVPELTVARLVRSRASMSMRDFPA